MSFLIDRFALCFPSMGGENFYVVVVSLSAKFPGNGQTTVTASLRDAFETLSLSLILTQNRDRPPIRRGQVLGHRALVSARSEHRG